MTYRGWLLSVAAIAGTATAAVVVYRYATRSFRVDEDGEGGRDQPNGFTSVGSHSSSSMNGGGGGGESEEEDTRSEVSAMEYQGLMEIEQSQLQDQQQQMMLVTREGNRLLLAIGVILMMLVAFVGLIVAMTSEESAWPTELPMFSPLMWIAFGILTAATTGVLGHDAGAAEVPVLKDKAVFPADERDFEMIDRYRASSSQSDYASSDRLRQATLAEGVDGLVDNQGEPDENEEKAAPPTDVTSVIAKAEELFVQNKHSETRDLLKGSLSMFGESIEMLWRLARACNYMVETTEDPAEKKNLASEGLSYAQKAYDIDPNSAASNKWMGIMIGSIGNFRDTKERIAGAYHIRDHIKRAIELDPRDPTCYNILGQWCLAFADLSWFEKKAAAALFGTPPCATYEDAVGHFLEAEKISPRFWKKNTLLLAQTYIKMKKMHEARHWAQEAKKIPVKTDEDREVELELVNVYKACSLL